MYNNPFLCICWLFFETFKTDCCLLHHSLEIDLRYYNYVMVVKRLLRIWICSPKKILMTLMWTHFMKFNYITLHKKWSFPLRIFSVNETKSAGICGFGHVCLRNPSWKTSFFVQCQLFLKIFSILLIYLLFPFHNCLIFEPPLGNILFIWKTLFWCFLI